MKYTELMILTPLLLMTVLMLGIEIRKNADRVIHVQKEKADELYAKFRDLLDDRVGTLQQGIDDLKKQQNRGDRE